MPDVRFHFSDQAEDEMDKLDFDQRMVLLQYFMKFKEDMDLPEGNFYIHFVQVDGNKVKVVGSQSGSS